MPGAAAFVLSLIPKWLGTKLPIAQGNYYGPN